jgi:hypothetical protein
MSKKVVTNLKKIKANGFSFLQSKEAIELAAKLSANLKSKLQAQLLLTPYSWGIIASEFSEKHSYIHSSCNYAKFPLPSNIDNEFMSSLQFEINNLFFKLIDLPNCKPLLEETLISLYAISVSQSIVFFGWGYNSISSTYGYYLFDETMLKSDKNNHINMFVKQVNQSLRR